VFLPAFEKKCNVIQEVEVVLWRTSGWTPL